MSSTIIYISHEILKYICMNIRTQTYTEIINHTKLLKTNHSRTNMLSHVDAFVSDFTKIFIFFFFFKNLKRFSFIFLFSFENFRSNKINKTQNNRKEKEANF